MPYEHEENNLVEVLIYDHERYGTKNWLTTSQHKAHSPKKTCKFVLLKWLFMLESPVSFIGIKFYEPWSHFFFHKLRDWWGWGGVGDYVHLVQSPAQCRQAKYTRTYPNFCLKHVFEEFSQVTKNPIIYLDKWFHSWSALTIKKFILMFNETHLPESLIHQM